VAVVGGGFAGLASALYLSEQGVSVAVFERDETLGSHSSGRNAGMIRQAIADPSTAVLAHEGRQALAGLEKKGWRDIGFRAIGSLLLANEKNGQTELRNISSSLRRAGVGSTWFSRGQATKKVSVLDGGDFEKALFCPTDAVVDIERIRDGFARALRARRVRLFCRFEVRKIHRESGRFLLSDGRKSIKTFCVVNAAGAWASRVGALAGATNIPLVPYRRHLYGGVPGWGGYRNWPFVWDLSHNFYFRPDGSSLLLSPCDEKAFKRLGENSGKAEAADPAVEKVLFMKLNSFCKAFRDLRIENRKAGLRTMSKDHRFVIGEDAKLKGFYWIAGLGGHGVTTCFAVGRLAGSMILGRRVDQRLSSAFSPARYQKEVS